MALFDLHAKPDLDAPVLVVALEGWIDAGLAAARALEHLQSQLDTTKVATFDADALVDFRARRPTMHLVDGVNTDLTWAVIEVHAATAPGGQDLLLLTGVEPDHAWHGFVHEVRDLAVSFGCRMQVGLGAYPAGAPHTRPVILSATASSDALAADIGFLRGTIDVPAGVEAAIERSFAAIGVPAVGIWAQVPHYTATMRYPAASFALVEGLNRVVGTAFDLTDLEPEVRDTRARIDQLLSANPEHQAMVRQLEQAVDEAGSGQQQLGDLPTGDDLAEELQRFLREQEEG